MNNCRFFLDDYRMIKAYFDKPFDASVLSKMVMRINGVKCQYHLERLPESDTYYKYMILLETDYIYGDNYEFAFNNQKYNLTLRHITSKPRFEKDFYADVRTLGSFFESDKTTFRVWAPLADKVRVHLLDYKKYVEMTYDDKGVYEAVVSGNYDQCKYLYEVTRNGHTSLSVDPFAYASGLNASYSVVLNPNKFIKEVVKPHHIIKSNTDAIIYEMSVRDMTSSPVSRTKTHSKFLSLCEEGTSFEGYATGLDYLDELGVTHVQMMPVFDFGSVDEIKQDSYNWGYDPVQYNVVDGTYISDVNNPYAWVNELRTLVNKLHSRDICVNLDVVFNHVYRTEDFAFERLMPYYSFRYYNDEYYSNGSYCGNEVRTESLILSDYFELMCERYIELFDIDGLRFDLMGLIDIHTMDKITKVTKNLKPYFMLYGEGWDMPTPLKNRDRSTMNNNYFMEDVGFFNPHFRDVVKGETMSNRIYDKGYILGNLVFAGRMRDALTAYVLNGYFKHPTQSINYIECHDNHTFFDKMKFCIPCREYSEYKARTRLSIAVTMLAQGVPFIHCGQEYMGTKYGNGNSYNSGDYYNQLDYPLRNHHYDLVEFFKDMVKIRKTYREFRYRSKELIEEHVRIDYYMDMLVYHCDDIVVFINPTEHEFDYELDQHMRMIYNRDCFDDVILKGHIRVQALSILIAKEFKNNKNK